MCVCVCACVSVCACVCLVVCVCVSMCLCMAVCAWLQVGVCGDIRQAKGHLAQGSDPLLCRACPQPVMMLKETLAQVGAEHGGC